MSQHRPLDLHRAMLIPRRPIRATTPANPPTPTPTPTPAPEPTFHPFIHLPFELQLQIWEHHLPFHTPQLITLTTNTNPTLLPTAKSSWPHHPTISPQLFLLSRSLTDILTKNTTHRHYFHTRLATPLLFNPVTDFLFFETLGAAMSFCAIKGGEVRGLGIKRIAVALMTRQSKRTMEIYDIIRAFWGLEELVFVMGKEEWIKERGEEEQYERRIRAAEERKLVEMMNSNRRGVPVFSLPGSEVESRDVESGIGETGMQMIHTSFVNEQIDAVFQREQRKRESTRESREEEETERRNRMQASVVDDLRDGIQLAHGKRVAIWDLWETMGKVVERMSLPRIVRMGRGDMMRNVENGWAE